MQMEVMLWGLGGRPEVFRAPRREGRRVRVVWTVGSRPPLPVFLFHIPDPSLEPARGVVAGSWLRPQDTPRKLVCLCACQHANLPLGPRPSQASPLSPGCTGSAPLSLGPRPLPRGLARPSLPPHPSWRLPQFPPSAAPGPYSGGLSRYPSVASRGAAGSGGGRASLGGPAARRPPPWLLSALFPAQRPLLPPLLRPFLPTARPAKFLQGVVYTLCLHFLSTHSLLNPLQSGFQAPELAGGRQAPSPALPL